MTDEANRIYGQAVPTPNDAQPWACVLYGPGGDEISRAGANSRDEAEALVRYFLEKLERFARKGFKGDPNA